MKIDEWIPVCETPNIVRVGSDQSGIGSCVMGVPGLEGSIRGGRNNLKGSDKGWVANCKLSTNPFEPGYTTGCRSPNLSVAARIVETPKATRNIEPRDGKGRKER